MEIFLTIVVVIICVWLPIKLFLTLRTFFRGEGGEEERPKQEIEAKQSNGFQEGMDAFRREDYKTAFRKWKPLAEQGNCEAQYNLGGLYFLGKGAKSDLIEAHKLMSIGIASGAKDLKGGMGIELVQRNMTHKQILKAEKEAFKWMEKHN